MICTNAERESNPVLRALNPMQLYIRNRQRLYFFNNLVDKLVL